MMQSDYNEEMRDRAKAALKRGDLFAIDQALTILGATIGTDAEDDKSEMIGVLHFVEEVFVGLAHDSTPPTAVGVIAYPNTDADAYDGWFVFDGDPPQYMQDLLADRNYDPYHDPYADHRSIASAGEMVRATASLDWIADFAASLGLPLVVMPDVSPGNYAGKRL